MVGLAVLVDSGDVSDEVVGLRGFIITVFEVTGEHLLVAMVHPHVVGDVDLCRVLKVTEMTGEHDRLDLLFLRVFHLEDMLRQGRLGLGTHSGQLIIIQTFFSNVTIGYSPSVQLLIF